VSQAPRIVIAAGGTAGHVVPALAVAEALREAGAQVTFVGGGRAEAELVPAAGFPLYSLHVEGLSRTRPLQAARALALALAASLRARALLRELAPHAVMGAGGYVAGPVGAAAVLRRLPLVLSEADSHLGLTNRLLAPFARRVCLAFPIAGLGGARYRVTGRPVAPSPIAREEARRRLGVGPQEVLLLVFGGSLGARSINLAAVAALTAARDAAGAPVRVLHISGRRDYQQLAGRELPPGYELAELLTPERFADALAAADLAVARAGGSVFELAVHGLPAILVPYPQAAADHQSANARWMSDGGAAVTIPDGELTPARLAAEVGALLGDRRRLAAMSQAARALARPDAARAVADELLAAAGS
jgi:UDP-N-acetylglucosamine--N-acetylmuramyl-(pentapeptide) pyrophosphoryl-undecaprenol N-acetylglucosamine transferase